MGGRARDKSPTKEAFDMGKRAFRKGIFHSPYKKTSVLHREWERGFNAAYFDNKAPPLEPPKASPA